MADHASICRYLVIQSCLGCAVGLGFAAALVALNVGGIRLLLAGEATTTIIFATGAVMTFCPLVIATAVGLLASRQ